jgi:fatty acid desaturase
MTTRTKITDYLSRDELKAFSERSDARGFFAIASTWAIIAASFALLARFPNPFVFVLVVIVLGGRQLALAILTHEAAHRSLFATRALNDVLTDWLCARPIWNDVARYREHHIRHHAHTNTERDPDASLSHPFPTTRVSLARKLLRDLAFVSGLRRILGLVLMDIGVLEYTVAADVKSRPRNGRTWVDYAREGIRNMSGMIVTNVALFLVLFALGVGWVYVAWVVAYLTTFSLFVRIRSLAEHACTEQTEDIFMNTRTTRAGFLARMTVAPVHVNYHIEHHALVSVPYYRLPALHATLRERGATSEPPTYVDVLRIVTSRTASQPI